MNLEYILSKFEKVSQNGKLQKIARCPAHDDKNPSLGIKYDPKEDKVILNCFAGCETQAVLDAVGLEFKDLYCNREQPSKPTGDAVQRFAAIRKHNASAYRHLGAESKGNEIFIPMRDAGGEITGWRKRRANNKPYGTGEKPPKCLSVKGRKNGLMYNRAAVQAADKLLVTEGGPDAAAAISAGCERAVISGGSETAVIGVPGSKPGKSCFKYLVKLSAGKDVILAPDPDDAGAKFRVKAGRYLKDAGARVRFIPPTGGDLDKRLRGGESMAELLESAVEWQPPQDEDGLDGMFYNSSRKEYVTKNIRGCYISRREGQMKRLLKRRGYSNKTKASQALSPVQMMLVRMEEEKDVQFVGPVCGRDAGFYEENGVRYLVTDSPVVIEPEPGEWPIIKQLLEGMFDPEQRAFLYGWLAIGYEALRRRQRRDGQALAIAGPADCYKSFIQNKIFTGVLGGRSARPFQFMSGGTQFNSDLFKAEHLIIEDEAASTDMRSRKKLGAFIKIFTVNEEQRCHAKGADAFMLRPFWRVSITMNDEPENLMLLPPMDKDLKSKLILLKATMPPRPMPTETPEERKKFEQAVLDELPAFCSFLDGYKIPKEMRSQRFGVKEHHQPEFKRVLDNSTPARKLLGMINSEIKDEYWKGTAEELQFILTDSQAGCRSEAQRLLDWPAACGTYLGRLAKKHPQRIRKKRTGESRQWIITRPSGEDN